MPLRRMKAMTTSMASADSISERSWLHRLGSPGALVSSVVSSSGMSGCSIGCGRAVGAALEDGVEDLGRVDRQLAGVGGDELAEPLEEVAGDLDADGDAVVLGHVGEGSLDLLAQVPGDAVGRLGAAERVLLGEQPLVDLREAGPQALGDEALEQARPEVIHGEKLRARRGRRTMRMSQGLRRVGTVTEAIEPQPPNHVSYDLDGALLLLGILEDARDALIDSGHLALVVAAEDQIRLLNRKLGFDDPEGDADVR